VDLLNCTGVCLWCGKLEVNNIATTEKKSVAEGKLTDKLNEVKPNTTRHMVVKKLTTYKVPFERS
jgi:hypothetical protein